VCRVAPENRDWVNVGGNVSTGSEGASGDAAEDE
jgi:hypothetical protein